jgi:PAS domain S-box-containing protein
MTTTTADQQQLHARNVRLQQENERLKQELAKYAHTYETLKASEDRYQALVEAQTELLCRFAPDGTLTFVNQTYCHKFGKTSETLLGTSFFRYIFPEDQEIVKIHLTSLRKDRPTGTLEYRIILPNGEAHWYQWTNHLLCDQQGHTHEFQAVGHDFCGYKEVDDVLERYHEQMYDLVIERTRDLSQSNARLQQEIAEHKRVERALKASEAQYRTLYENAPNGYFSIGTDGMIKRCNRTASDLLGYTRDELLHMHMFDLYADLPEGLPKARTIFQRFRAGEDIHDEELQMQRKDGTPVWISLTVSPVSDQRGRSSNRGQW